MGICQEIKCHKDAQEAVNKGAYKAEDGAAGHLSVFFSVAGEMLAYFLSQGVYHFGGVLAELQAALSYYVVRPICYLL